MSWSESPVAGSGKEMVLKTLPLVDFASDFPEAATLDKALLVSMPSKLPTTQSMWAIYALRQGPR
jgi:hypothetical protein